jgi:catechol-2,3-dioxygenase
MKFVKAHIPKTAKERGRIAPTRLAHVVRRTSRLDEMVEWYCKVLEAEVVLANDLLAFLTYDEEHHRIAIAAIPGLVEQQEHAVGTDHIAFTYENLSDLLHTYRRLKELGITPFWAINHGPTTSFYYKDPDNNRVELQIDNFATVEAVDEWLNQGEFDENPIGVVFDPEELCARYDAGVSEQELVARPPLPEGTTPLDMLRF